jgi:hypothetical protein
MNYEQRTTNSNKHRGGMAMLAVLFIVFAVVVVSMGYLYRSDSALACGQNLCQRNRSDGLAWAGLEHARAVIQSYGTTPLKEPNSISISAPPYTLDSNWYYDLNISASAHDESDPNHRTYTYDVTCEAWYGADKQARSYLHADIRYWANDPNGRAEFISVRRQ